MIKKNEEYIVDIIDQGYEGEGIAKIDNFTIFIPEAIKKEKIKIHIVKVNTSFAFAKIIEIIEKSEDRVLENDCDTYTRCGGCSLRHIKYNETLNMKKDMVQNLVNKELDGEVQVNNVVGMESPEYYRNKLQYPIGKDKNNKVVMGVFAGRSHDVIKTDHCLIQNKKSQEVANFIYQYIFKNNLSVYDEIKKAGLLRHLVIKIGIKTNEIMCIFVVNGIELPGKDDLVQRLVQKFPEIKTILLNRNTKNTNVILGKNNTILYGEGYIYDRLDEYEFKISPLSFYQTNPIQTEKLYHLAMEEANLNKGDIVLDLYCGIGTIGILTSRYVKKVYGIEIIEEAINDAKENAKINKIQNIEFIVGDVENTLDKLMKKERILPSVIFVDPPRKGLEKNAIDNILKIEAKKVIYISCNPKTMVRDLKDLKEKYNIKSVTPVDMFPYTSHIECVTLLTLKGN